MSPVPWAIEAILRRQWLGDHDDDVWCVAPSLADEEVRFLAHALRTIGSECPLAGDMRME